MTELAKYEAARKALAAAVAVDEVAEIRNQAEAMRHYAHQAGDRALEIQAAQIRFRAERRLGELIIAQKETVGLNRGRAGAGRPRLGDSDTEAPKPDDRPTLREVGIDHKLSSRVQQIAAMGAAAFEHALARHAEEMRAGAGRVAMDLRKIGSEERGRAHRRNLAAALSEQSAALPSGRRFAAMYLDPPWKRQGGIGDRAYENHYPTMPWPEILAYLRQAADCLLPDAWAFMWIPRAHLLALVEIELEAMVIETGQATPVRLEVPLAWACQIALGMDSYSTCFVWTKTDEDHPDVSGSGLIAFDQDELLLLFKRGQGLPKPAGSEKFGSNHRERATDHSRKPVHYRRMISAMVGCDGEGRPLPVLELFARVDADHPLPPGWQAAGNQAQVSPATAIEEGGGFPVAAAPQYAEETGGDASSHGGASSEITFAAGVPSDAGETATVAAEATADGASPVAAVADNFNPDDVEECLALKVLSDFCHPRRAELVDLLGPRYQAKGLAYQSGAHWSLREAGWQRLRELTPAPAVPLTEPYRAPTKPQLTLDLPAPEIVDGKIQTRLPVDEDELAEQLALLEIAGGHRVEGDMLRHLVGKGFAFCGLTKISVTDEGRAFLAQLVTPALGQQSQVTQ